MFHLKPVGNGAKFIRAVEIDTASVSETITLGRNDDTFHLDGRHKTIEKIEFVSRSHVELRVVGQKVFMKNTAKVLDIVFLNDNACTGEERELQLGDRVSLIGKMGRFNFEFCAGPQSLNPSEPSAEQKSADDNEGIDNVVFSLEESSGSVADETVIAKVAEEEDKPVAAPPTTAPPTAAPPATAPPLAPPSAQTGQDATKNLLKKLLRQYECSICYETMACSFSLSPCGDSFCYTCIKDWSEAATKCPLCQETFELKNSLPSKLSDNTIRDILSNDEAELKAWESRCSEGLANKRETDLGASSSSSSGIGIPIPPLSRATSRFTAGASSHHSTVSNISNVYNATHSNFVNLYHSSALPDQNVFGFNGRNVPATSLGVRSERKRKSNQMTIAPGTAAASSG
jgi:hypothetical protein